MKPGNPVTSIRTAARECTDVQPRACGSGSPEHGPIRVLVKRLAILLAAGAALAITPAAAASPNPGKSDKPAKAERAKKAKPDSARARCAAEKKDLGPAGFAAKYGKPRTKGSGKAKAKAARAAMGRCVSRTAKAIRAERERDEDEADTDLDELEEEDADCWCDDSGDASEEFSKPEDDGTDADPAAEDQPSKLDEDDDPVAPLLEPDDVA